MKPCLLVLILFAFTFIGCTKNVTKTSETLLRIENTTNESLNEVISNNVNFEAIDSLSTTGYHSFSTSVLPLATVIKGIDTLYVGTYYTDSPQPTFQDGKYTMKISKDSGSYSGYKLLMIKD